MLHDRVILVTGAGGGLGRSFSEAVHRAGASVVMFDNRAEEVHAAAHELRSDRAIAVAGSTTEESDVQRAIAVSRKRFGGLHGLVNNAAISHEASFPEEDVDRMRRTVEVNVFGPLLCAVKASAEIARSGGGSIVNVSSGAALGLANATVYSATKGAVSSLSLSLALELEPSGIRVNTLGPLAATGMGDRSSSPTAKVRPAPDAISPAVIWLLSDRSSGVTGQFIRFDGRSLRMISNPRLKDEVVVHESWDDEVFDAAMTQLRIGFEPYGIVPTMPPLLRG